MSKFYYCDLDQIFKVEKLLTDKDPRREVVLNENESFKDVVRYNREYDTAVFLTIAKKPHSFTDITR